MKKTLSIFFTFMLLASGKVFGTRSYFINRLPNKKAVVIAIEKMPEKRKFFDFSSPANVLFSLTRAGYAVGTLGGTEAAIAITQKINKIGEGTIPTEIKLANPGNEYSKSKPEWIDSGDRTVEGVIVQVEGYKPIDITQNETLLKEFNKGPGLYIVITEENGKPVIYMSGREERKDRDTEALFESCRDVGNSSSKHNKQACKLGQKEPKFVLEKLTSTANALSEPSR